MKCYKHKVISVIFVDIFRVVYYHRLRGSGSTVVTMTSKVNGKMEILLCLSTKKLRCFFVILQFSSPSVRQNFYNNNLYLGSTVHDDPNSLCNLIAAQKQISTAVTSLQSVPVYGHRKWWVMHLQYLRHGKFFPNTVKPFTFISTLF